MQSSEDTHHEIQASVISDKLKCTSCSEEFLDQQYFREHERTKHIGKIKTCGLCPKTFPHRKSLKSHMAKMHSNIIFSCDICQSNFPSKIYLTMHQNMHKEEKSYKCGSCKSQFNFNTTLRDHTQKHHKGPPSVETLTCNVCTKEFHSINGLQRHEQSIHHEITFPCTICSHKAKDKPT